MILVIGGAFQGKRTFVKNKFNICEDKIFDEFHLKIKNCIIEGKDCNKLLDEIFNGDFEVIISNEIGSGIVPIEKNDRLWREEVGRALCILAKRCDQVWRVSLGIGIRIK